MARDQIIVYPTRDLENAKKLFTSLLGTDPYGDIPYYVGFGADGREIGIDPHGSSGGPIVYWEADGIAGTVAELAAAVGRSPAMRRMSPRPCSSHN